MQTAAVDRDSLVLQSQGLISVLASVYTRRPFLSHEDLIQEGNVVLLKEAEKWDPARGDWGKFASAVLSRTFRDMLAREKKRSEVETTAGAKMSAVPDPAPVLEAEDFAQTYLGRLNERQREVVEAKVHGKSFARIAKEQGVTYQAVQKQYNAALDLLRKMVA